MSKNNSLEDISPDGVSQINKLTAKPGSKENPVICRGNILGRTTKKGVPMIQVSVNYAGGVSVEPLTKFFFKKDGQWQDRSGNIFVE